MMYSTSSSAMAKKKRRKVTLALLAAAIVVAVVLVSATVAAAAKRRRHKSSSSDPFASSSTMGRNYDITWAPDHVKLSGQQQQQQLDLLLNQASGAGFGSRNRYLFGDLGIQLRLVQNDASGTVVAYYISSLTDDRDEYAFQFFGNSSGNPYTLQTNVFVKGVGGREQRLVLWFDPTADFHSYSVVWNPFQVIFMVDNIPVRVFREKSNRPMGIYTSIWAGGLSGAPPVNWDHAPFVVSYLTSSLSSVDGCQYSEQSPELCFQSDNHRWWSSLQWNSELQGNLTLVKSRYLVYDYCNDKSRYPTAPIECSD